MKNKLSKIIRIVTIAPIMAAVMLAIIQLAEPEQIGGASNLNSAYIFNDTACYFIPFAACYTLF